VILEEYPVEFATMNPANTTFVNETEYFFFSLDIYPQFNY
jgi:hypothetical protein